MSALSSGSRLGPYEITAAIGKGGMGEVFRARDTTLNRDVAIKVLPAAMAGDAERLARFKREAQVLASLNHPNIAHVYGFESATLDGGATVHFLAREMVEGEDLAERLKRGAIPIDESIAIAKQIAEGLEEAHEKGIVHRDLKPANVKLTPDGKVKVLDFGLAKAYEGDSTSSASNSQLADSPTMSRHMTEAGMILGTAAYMSPEQARGKTVDKRADIWSFGVVLFEMLTGTRAFAGETVSDTLAAVLKTDPDWALLPAEMPGALKGLLGHCLARDPRQRLRDIGDARFALSATAEAGAVALAPTRTGPSRRILQAGWGVAAVLAVLAVALVLRVLAPAQAQPMLRFAISSASGATVDPTGGSSAISPDGRRVAFVGGDRTGRQGLWIQQLDRVRAGFIEGTEGARFPFWSPDSREVAFFSKGKLRRASLDDSRVETICDAAEGRGGSWSKTGMIVFAPAVTGGLSVVSSRGGVPREATRIENAKEENSHRFPSFLPDGRRFVYLADPGADADEGRVFLASLDGEERRLLFRSRRAPVYAAPGFLVYAIGDRLVARAFDAQAGEARGEPRRLEEPTPAFQVTQERVASVSDSGVLLVAGARTSGTDVLELDRSGRLLSRITLPGGEFAAPRLSPDGRRLLILATEGDRDLWIVDLQTRKSSRLTFGKGRDARSIWSSSGADIVSQSRRFGVFDLWIRPSSGGGAERPLYESSTPWKDPGSWVGDLLAFGNIEQSTGFDISLIRPDRPGIPPTPLLNSPASEREPAISPDGKWLAYQSNESGRNEIYVVSLPDGKRKYQVTTDGGGRPIWTQGGREVIYSTGYSAGATTVFAVPVVQGTVPSFGTPTPLFSRPFTNWGTGNDDSSGFDVSRDGSRIFMLASKDEAVPTLVVVTNWLASLSSGQ